MAKQNASDSNYIDGCVYRYLANFSIGNYLFSFECSDGVYETSTDTFKLSVIKPPLSAPRLNFISPNPNTNGLIKLNWSVITGAMKYYIYRNTSSITSVSRMNPIAKVNVTNYTDTLTINGTYYYVIVAGNTAENSSISNCESICVAIQPLNSFPPTLFSKGVKPHTGTQFTNFTFTVIYTDQDDNLPVSIHLLIDEIAYAMRKQNSSDINYKDGCIFNYTTHLTPGIYNYSFRCYDGKFFTQLSRPNFRLVVHDANIPFIRNFTLFSPLTDVRDTTPTIICQIFVTGAGINLSSVQYAYSTTGNLTPINWAPVNGVYLDAACTLSASDGATGVLYLKVDAVPFNHPSLTKNIIRFGAADMAGIQIIQSLPITIKITKETHPTNSIIFIIISIGAIAISSYSNYIIVRERKKEQKIQDLLEKVLSTTRTCGNFSLTTKKYCTYSYNSVENAGYCTPSNDLIKPPEAPVEELPESNELINRNLGKNPSYIDFMKLFKIFWKLNKAFPSIKHYIPEIESLIFLRELKSLPDEEIFAFISTLLEKVSIIEVQTQISVLMNELKDSQEHKNWKPILHKIEELIYRAEALNDEILLNDLFSVIVFIKYSPEIPIELPSESQIIF
jgi:hypothetical protein